MTNVVRVAFVSSHALPGGSERYLEDLLDRLQTDWIAGVVSLQDGWLVDRLRAVGRSVTVVPTPARLGVLPAAWQLRRVLSTMQPEVVHANGVKAALVAGLAMIGTGVPILWLKHDFFWDGPVAVFTARLCAEVVGVSRAVIETFGTRFVDRVKVVPNGIRRVEVDPMVGRRRLEALLGLQAADRVVLLLGRLHPVKGALQLIHAAPVLLARRPDAVVAVIGGEDPGEPGLLEELRAQIKALGVGDRVRFAGHQDDPMTLIAGADVLAVPSGPNSPGLRGEGFGLVALEAMAVGTPVVAYDAGALPEVLDGCGVLVPPGDPDELAGALADVLENPRLVERLVVAARRRATERYDLSRVAADMKARYRAVAGSKDGRGADKKLSEDTRYPPEPMPLPPPAALEGLARASGRRALLWRGLDRGSGDIDVLVPDDALAAAEGELLGVGLQPSSAGEGRTIWRDPGSSRRDIDILAESEWPPWYPTLFSVRSRASMGDAPLAIASVEDRLLMLASEAVLGQPLEKIVGKARSLLERPGARPRLAAVGTAQGAAELAALIAHPDELADLARQGRLPYGPSVRLAARSRVARAALRHRLIARVRIGGIPRLRDVLAEMRVGPRRASRPGVLVTFSGMDGCGKSTAAEVARAELEARGWPAELAWARLAADSHLLDRLSQPVKSLLRRGRSIADPLAAGGSIEAAIGGPPGAAAAAKEAPRWAPASLLATPVDAAWVGLVGFLAVRAHRRATKRCRTGMSVVCDRWRTDALVDLEIRYGRRPLVAGFLRRAVPRPDVELFLQIDAVTAGQRKPDDQAQEVLERMEDRYAAAAARTGAQVIDARRSTSEIAADIRALIDVSLPTDRARATPGVG